MKTGIRARFVAFALAVGLTAVAAVSVVTAISTRRVLLGHQNRLLVVAAHRTAGALHAFVEDNLDLLRTQAQIPALARCLEAARSSGTPSPSQPAITEAADLLQRLSLRDDVYLESYSLLDRNGRTVADSVADRAGEVADPVGAIRSALTTGLPSAVAVIPRPGSDASPFLNLVCVVRAASGDALGVLRVRYHLAVVQALVARDTGLLGARGVVMVVDRDGRFVAEGSDADWVGTAVARRWPKVADRLAHLEGPSVPLALDGSSGEGSRVAGAPVDYLGWRVVVAQPITEFLAPVWAYTRSLVVTALLVALLAAFAALVAAERFARPIARLTHHAERVAAGELEAEAAAEGPREIAALGAAFGEMTRRVRDLLIGLQREVDDRSRAERGARASEERLRAILENALDIVYAHDAQGTILFMSPSVERWLGVPPQELVGRQVEEIVHPDDRSRIPKWRDPAEGGAAVHMQTLRWRAADGSWHTMETASRNALDLPALAAVIVSARDVTEREQAAEQQRKLEASLAQARSLEAIGLLAGGVAHDLNNLLMPILGYTELVLADMPLDAPGRRYLLEVQDAARRARDLVSQLLAFGRRQRLDVRAVDMVAELRGLEKLLRTSLTERIGLALALPDEPVVVAADAAEFQRVVMNLAVNARDAMADGGRLDVEVGQVILDATHAAPYDLPAGTYGQLVLRDTGHGMDAETREHAFEPFFSTKERGRGTGLGLASVFGIVRQHRGGIRVESAPGEGTSFDILWPLASARTVDIPAATRVEKGHGETILLVEDDSAVREIVRLTLEDAGYHALPAENAEQALALARDRPGSVDLLVSDVVMPGTSGPALFDILRREGLTTRALFMSGYADDALRHSERLPPGLTVLTKPFSPTLLLAAVARALIQIPG